MNMTKRFHIHALLAVALLVSGCSKEASVPGGEGYGRIRLDGAPGTLVTTRAEVDVTTLGVEVPAPGAFALSLVSDEFSGNWETIDRFNAADELYPAGTYTATVSWGDPEREGENKPYYTGSADFVLEGGESVSRTIPARIANSLVEIRVTEAFRQYFHDIEFTLATGSGNTFGFRPDTETASAPIFVKAGTSVSVSGTARRQSQTGEADDPGPEVGFSTRPIEAAAARTRHIFTFDAANAGSATVTVTLEDGTESIEPIDIELNDRA